MKSHRLFSAGHFHLSTCSVQATNELVSCYGNVLWENFGEEKLWVIFICLGPVPIATGELVTDYQLVSMELAASSGLLMPPSVKPCDLPGRTCVWSSIARTGTLHPAKLLGSLGLAEGWEHTHMLPEAG